MTHRLILIALGCFILCAPCLSEPLLPGTELSQEQAQVYKARWNEWMASPILPEQRYKKIASDFEDLAMKDLFAALLAITQTNLSRDETDSITALLKPETRRALNVLAKYYVAYNKAKRTVNGKTLTLGNDLPVYPASLPPLGKGLAARLPSGSGEQSPLPAENPLHPIADGTGLLADGEKYPELFVNDYNAAQDLYQLVRVFPAANKFKIFVTESG